VMITSVSSSVMGFLSSKLEISNVAFCVVHPRPSARQPRHV
jgi:hypothetical protein